jgi:CheY-like chemotaxis protein
MGKTILLADDSITIQKIVNLTFSGEGIDVVTVGNGDAALKKIYDVRPDLVLADIFMPGKNGYEVCEHIKNDAELPSIPVILLVGAFEPFDRNEAARVKADGHLTKPFEIKVLISAVNSLISAAEQEKVTESVKEIPRADAEIPPASEEVASSPHETPEPAEPEVEIPEWISAPAVTLGAASESATSAAEPASVAECSYSVTTSVALEEPAVELVRKQDQVIEESRPEVPSFNAEDSDPLGLYTSEFVPGERGDKADLSMDSRSFVVDIWEHRSTYVEDMEVLPVITEERQKGQVAVMTAGLEETAPSEPVGLETVPTTSVQSEEETADTVESIAKSSVSIAEDLSAPRKAVLTSSETGEPLGKETVPFELVDLVAERVIERLSREVIEKIAWEVIPDMAEIVIKEYMKSRLDSTGKV